jgi:hypothetical protein
MKALNSNRTGEEKKVTVQNISNAESGQAVIGNVTQAVRGSFVEKTAPSPSSTFTGTNVVPMPKIERNSARVRVTSKPKLEK